MPIRQTRARTKIETESEFWKKLEETSEIAHVNPHTYLTGLRIHYSHWHKSNSKMQIYTAIFFQRMFKISENSACHLHFSVDPDVCS